MTPYGATTSLLDRHPIEGHSAPQTVFDQQQPGLRGGAQHPTTFIHTGAPIQASSPFPPALSQIDQVNARQRQNEAAAGPSRTFDGRSSAADRVDAQLLAQAQAHPHRANDQTPHAFSTKWGITPLGENKLDAESLRSMSASERCIRMFCEEIKGEPNFKAKIDAFEGKILRLRSTN